MFAFGFLKVRVSKVEILFDFSKVPLVCVLNISHTPRQMIKLKVETKKKCDWKLFELKSNESCE